MELGEYLRLGRKWLWLLLTAAFVGGGLSYSLNAARPLFYVADTTVSIGRYIDASNPNITDIQTGITLAETYAQLVRTSDVLQGTIDALDLRFSPQQLNSLLNTRILNGTSLLVITVRHTDPVLAADIANTVAEQLISRSPSNLTADQQSQIDIANTQIEALENQIEVQRQNLTVISTELESATEPDEITRLNNLRTQLTQQTTNAALAIAQFQSNISSLQQGRNSVDIVERASIPVAPQGTGTTMAILLGSVVAVAIVGGFIFLLEYLDDHVKTTEFATQLLNIPIVGAIPSFGKKNTDYADRLVLKTETMSPAAEAYRRLHTNLILSSNKRKSVFVITSAGPSEGKSVTAANLAAAMASNGLRVLLLDADLRRPRVHTIFGLDNSIGLSSLLKAEPDLRQKPDNDQSAQVLANLNQCIQLTEIPNLKVITSGFIPANPVQVLSSTLMKRWLEAFRAAQDIDVVIIDTPPVLLFGDSLLIATAVEAEIVLVLDCTRTRSKTALETKERFTQVGLEVKGLILNRINPNDETGSYGYEYSYGYTYYAADDRTQGKRRGLFKLRQ